MDERNWPIVDEHLNFIGGTPVDAPIQELVEKLDGFKRAYKSLKQHPNDFDGRSLTEKASLCHSAFDQVHNRLERCISKWSLSERRRANELTEGGIDPTDTSKSILVQIKLIASKCVKILCKISSIISNVDQLHQETMNRIHQLAHMTIVVTKFSSQILKKNKNIDIELELLIAHALKQNDPSFVASVSFSLVCESELQQLLANPDEPSKKATSLQVVAQSDAANSGAKLSRRKRVSGTDSDAAVGRWIYTLKRSQSPAKGSSPEEPSASNARSNSAQLSRNRRLPDRSVTEIKSAVVFDVRIVFRGSVWLFRTHSMPVVLASHVKQQSACWCTLFWDNAFSADERRPFEVPESTSKSCFLSSLRQWFEARTGGKLSDSNMQFLEQCLPNQVTMHSLANFNQNSESLRFPFWSWFYKCTRLICQNMQIQKFWRNQWIHGFISVADARDLLYRCPPGGALIRFSTKSKKGAIWLLQRPRPDEFMVNQPIRKYGYWKLKDFEKLDFHNTLFDLRITCLIPQIFWAAELGLTENDFRRNSTENDSSSDLEGIEYVPTIIRRCCDDPITELLRGNSIPN